MLHSSLEHFLLQHGRMMSYPLRALLISAHLRLSAFVHLPTFQVRKFHCDLLNWIEKGLMLHCPTCFSHRNQLENFVAMLLLVRIPGHQTGEQLFKNRRNILKTYLDSDKTLVVYDLFQTSDNWPIFMCSFCKSATCAGDAPTKFSTFKPSSFEAAVEKAAKVLSLPLSISSMKSLAMASKFSKPLGFLPIFSFPVRCNMLRTQSLP